MLHFLAAHAKKEESSSVTELHDRMQWQRIGVRADVAAVGEWAGEWRVWQGWTLMQAGPQPCLRLCPHAWTLAMPPCVDNPAMQRYYLHQEVTYLSGSIFPSFLFWRGDGRKNRFRELRAFRYLHRILRPALGVMLIWICEGHSAGIHLAVILGQQPIQVDV